MMFLVDGDMSLRLRHRSHDEPVRADRIGDRPVQTESLSALAQHIRLVFADGVQEADAYRHALAQAVVVPDRAGRQDSWSPPAAPAAR